LSLDDLEKLATSYLQDEKTNWMKVKWVMFVTCVTKLWYCIFGFVYFLSMNSGMVLYAVWYDSFYAKLQLEWVN
jgi:hypothetical protein